MAKKERDLVRDTSRGSYKYQFKVGRKVVYLGITEDVERREKEHQEKWPSGHIKKVGRKTTNEAARKWETDQLYSVYGHARKHTRSKTLKQIFRKQDA